jgi:hypothetical protein
MKKIALMLVVAVFVLAVPAKIFAYHEGTVIVSVSDFRAPLSAYGRWVYCWPYGDVWVPSGVGRDWRPYSVGYWEWTDYGWYWVSDEPWAWACYRYGRWVWNDFYGWVWVPDVVWAPAWVVWHSGGGYIGWAPMPVGYCVYRPVYIRPTFFLFIEVRRFHKPIHPSVCVPTSRNVTILQQTVNVTNIQIVNQKTAVVRGPKKDDIERNSGRPVRTREIAARPAQPTPAVALSETQTHEVPRGRHEVRPQHPREMRVQPQPPATVETPRQRPMVREAGVLPPGWVNRQPRHISENVAPAPQPASPPPAVVPSGPPRRDVPRGHFEARPQQSREMSEPPQSQPSVSSAPQEAPSQPPQRGRGHAYGHERRNR